MSFITLKDVVFSYEDIEAVPNALTEFRCRLKRENLWR